MTQLPELPTPEQRGNFKQPLYSTDQMRAYAELAIANQLADIRELREMAITLSRQAREDIATARTELASVKREPLRYAAISDIQKRWKNIKPKEVFWIIRDVERAHGIDWQRHSDSRLIKEISGGHRWKEIKP